MPDSTGFGDYTESGQVIPVSFRGRKGSYTHCMFLNDHPPIAGGRELWGFPKKLASPTLRTETDTLVGTLDYGPVRVATGTMGYKHKAADLARGEGVARGTELPAQDHSPCRRHAAHLRTRRVPPGGRRSEGAPGRGPASLNLWSHALAPVAELPVLEVVSAMHLVADLTLALGKVVHDYLAQIRSLTTGKEEPMNLHSKTPPANRLRATARRPAYGQGCRDHRRRERHRQGDCARLRPRGRKGGDRGSRPEGGAGDGLSRSIRPLNARSGLPWM